MPPLILAIDQGSSATKAAVYDPATGERLALARAPVLAFTPRGLLGSVRNALRAIAAACPEVERRRVVVGIANQRSTLVYLDAAGMPARRLIPWWETGGADPRARTPGERAWFRHRTGLPLLPNWWAGKLSRAATARVLPGRPGTVDTMIVAWLTSGVYATDLSNAARTGLVDVSCRRRTRKLQRFFGLPDSLPLPRLLPSVSAKFGRLTTDRARHGIQLDGRIAAVVGDAGAALLGMTGGEPGTLTVTLGTGGFLHLPCGARSRVPSGLYLAPAWSGGDETTWTLEAAIPGMASALKAGCREVGLAADAWKRMTPRRPRRRVTAILLPEGAGALGPDGIRGIHLEGAWDQLDAEERLGGLLDGLAHLVARAVERFPGRPRRLVAGGGLSRSPYLLARLADFTGLAILRCAGADATVHGAARLAARAIGTDLPSLAASLAANPRLDAIKRRALRERFENALGRMNSSLL